MALVVFTGGARSGKSSAAQALAWMRHVDGQPVIALVFGDGADDAEMAARIDRHREERPDGFTTLESNDLSARDVAARVAELEPGSLILVDCLGTLLGSLMHRGANGDDIPHIAESLEADLNIVLDALSSYRGDVIVVTNEVGNGVVPPYQSGRLFRDVLGRANRRLVETADAGYLVVAGRLIDISTLPRQVRWPED